MSQSDTTDNQTKPEPQMTKQITLHHKGLYVLSGLSASGKSTLTQGLKPYVLSADAEGKWLGTGVHLNETGQLREHLPSWSSTNIGLAHQITRLKAEHMIKQGLPVIIDSTNLDEVSRFEYEKLARKYMIPFGCLVMDALPINELVARDDARKLSVGPLTLKRQKNTFVGVKKSNETWVNHQTQLSIMDNALDPSQQWYVVGDVHGLKEPLGALLKQMGFENGQKAGAKLLFMGDVVDRGPESIEVLCQIKQWVAEQKAVMILGNHEEKLLRFIREFKLNKGEGPLKFTGSIAVKQTQVQWLKFYKNNPTEALALGEFLAQLPLAVHLTQHGQKVGFVHADQRVFKPMPMKSESCFSADLMFHQANVSGLGIPLSSTETVQGVLAKDVSKEANLAHEALDAKESQVPSLESKKEAQPYWSLDYEFDQLKKKGVNDCILMRGHIPLTCNEQNSVYSLDRHQAFDGVMLGLNVSDFLQKANGAPTQALFEQLIFKQQTNFSFTRYCKENHLNLEYVFDKLKEAKLLHEHENNGLFVYSFSKRAFWERSWNEHEILKKLRGVVLDGAFNVVSLPFDKVFNHTESEAPKINESTMVKVVKKENGFLFNIAPHPFEVNQLIYSTKGSTNSEFTKKGMELLTGEQKGKLLSYFSRSEPLTLMFEAIHPEDPHIISYSKDQQGLYLIGARKPQWDSVEYTEEQLDQLAQKFGFKRPEHENMTYGKMLEKLKVVEHEGFMVRSLPEQKSLVKAKSWYYLVNKFVARASENIIKKMYANPASVKRDDMEEEFYDVVDALVQNVPKESLLEKTEEQRKVFIKEFIKQMNAGQISFERRSAAAEPKGNKNQKEKGKQGSAEGMKKGLKK